MIPKPLSSLQIRYGAPRWVSREASEDEVKGIALDLEEELKGFTLELNPAEAQIRKELHAQS
jgi:hypothetical protein